MRMSQNATPRPPRNARPIAAAYTIASRITPSSAKARKRAERPAGRSSSRMPSGVSTATTVSRMSARRGRSSGLDDDGVGNVVVQTAPCFTEDEQNVDETVQRDDAEHAVDDV